MPVIRVLIIEDYAPWAKFLHTLISQEPSLQVVDVASDGQEGLRKAAELKPDLVLLDVTLPGINGIDVACELKRTAHNPLVLFVSQNPSPAIVAEALATGAGGYVLKTEAKDIVRAISIALAGGVFLSASLQIRNLPTYDGC
jgi:DNA-binding NarL/FixJ family response regulator